MSCCPLKLESWFPLLCIRFIKLFLFLSQISQIALFIIRIWSIGSVTFSRREVGLNNFIPFINMADNTKRRFSVCAPSMKLLCDHSLQFYLIHPWKVEAPVGFSTCCLVLLIFIDFWVNFWEACSGSLSESVSAPLETSEQETPSWNCLRHFEDTCEYDLWAVWPTVGSQNNSSPCPLLPSPPPGGVWLLLQSMPTTCPLRTASSSLLGFYKLLSTPTTTPSLFTSTCLCPPVCVSTCLSLITSVKTDRRDR